MHARCNARSVCVCDRTPCARATNVQERGHPQVHAVGRVVVKKTSAGRRAACPSCCLEKELVQVGKHAVEGAEEQDEESEKGVADGVVCAIVEDADGVENIQLVLPTRVSR